MIPNSSDLLGGNNGDLGYKDKDNSDQHQSSRRTKSCKRSWSQAEDEKLIKLVEDHGSINWSIIAENFEGRTGKQCRERYNNHLQPNIKKGDWTPEEDMIIVEMQAKYGNHWSKITKMLPGRTDNAIKNRWHAAVRATSRGTYTKDCGLLSNIRRQPIIPRLQLDTISVSSGSKEPTVVSSSYLPSIATSTMECLSAREQSQLQASIPVNQQTLSLHNLEILSLYTTNLMALAHDHTHEHMPIKTDNDSDDDYDGDPASSNEDSGSCSTSTTGSIKKHTPISRGPFYLKHLETPGNESSLTARSNISVNSVDLNTLIGLIKAEHSSHQTHSTPFHTSSSLQHSSRSQLDDAAEVAYDFDWQSPRLLEDRSPRIGEERSPRFLDDHSPRPMDSDRSPRLGDGWTPRLQHETPRLLDGRSVRLPEGSTGPTRLPDGGPMLKRFRGLQSQSHSNTSP